MFRSVRVPLRARRAITVTLPLMTTINPPSTATFPNWKLVSPGSLESKSRVANELRVDVSSTLRLSASTSTLLGTGDPAVGDAWSGGGGGGVVLQATFAG